jgi:uncharacterized membrane protein YfcA
VTSSKIAQAPPPVFARSSSVAFLGGALIGVLGGLIGLGGAEFRLPLLIGLFAFGALEAIILNKAISLIVVASALVFRSRAVPVAAVVAHVSIVATLLDGSLLGAWFGADLATRLKSQSLYRIISVLLIGIAVVLLSTHKSVASSQPLLTGTLQTLVGIGTGFIIGVVAAFLGVAGGELLIPTLVLLFGVDIKLAGSLSLAVSLPTMIVGFTRYSRDRSFTVLGKHPRFVLAMALGSIAGAFIGGLLLGAIQASILLPMLAVVLVLSAVKLWRHRAS